MTSNRQRAITIITAKALLGASLVYGFASLPSAHADTINDQPSPVATINLTDIPLDDYPVCQQEDCSDVPNQEGRWESSKGYWYLDQGEAHTWLIIDNTEGNAVGCYNDKGVMVSAAPCHIIVNPDGSSDVYDDATPTDDNAIVRLADGSIDDCTVTHANGDRADFHQECDDYWSWR